MAKFRRCVGLLEYSHYMFGNVQSMSGAGQEEADLRNWNCLYRMKNERVCIWKYHVLPTYHYILDCGPWGFGTP